MKYLKLIRYQNLLLLALMQLIFRYGYLNLQGVILALNHFQFALLILSTVLIAAGGYVINDIFDQDVDAENKPNKLIIGKSISESIAYNLYIGLTLSGVIIGYYLSNLILHPNFVVFYILIASLLYFYASQLKQIMIIGNLVVALLLSSSILLMGAFDLFPATYDGNREAMSIMFSILLDYAIFAFLINFIRELVKDIEDFDGDFNNGLRTLPIAIGKDKASKIAIVLIIISLFILLYYINHNLLNNNLLYSVLYSLVFILAPLIYCAIKLWSANKKSDFSHVSFILKWIIFFGIISIAIINYNIIQNVQRA